MSWRTPHALVLALLMAGGLSAAPSLSLQPVGNGQTWQLEITFDAPQFVESDQGGVSGHEVLLDGAGWIGRSGAPDLPSVQRLLEIPDFSGVQLTLVDGDFELVPDIHVLPCQERLHTDAELPLAWVEDVALYATNAFWPGQPYELGTPALLRNHRVVTASFQPVQVNPVTGTAKVWQRMVFDVRFDGRNPLNARTFQLASQDSPLDRAVRQQITTVDSPDAAPLETGWFDTGRLPGNYLVFANTTAQANPAFVDLMNWKRKKGHRVVLVSQNDLSFTTGNIRNRIIAEYTGANPVDFVLLVGDVDGTFAIPTDGTAYDHFYATVDGTDILGDVAVGRLSVDNATQLATVCNKILQYESAPYVASTGWFNHAVLHVGSSACYLSMKHLSRSIAAEMVERRGYNDIDTNFCVDASQLPSWFSSGISFYNYRGYIGMDGLSNATIMALAQGPRTPVATIFTCSTGDFNSGDDFTESFLMAGDPSNPGGAVACMGFATSSTHTRYNNVVVGGYYSGLLEHDLPSVGACLLQGKYELYATLPPSEQYQAANFANWGNLMGDPGTEQWAGTPAALAVNTPSTLGLGANYLTLTVTSGGQPVADAAVCLWQDLATDIQVKGLTNAAGQVTLNFSGLQAGTVYVTTTEHRHQPLLQTVTVGAATAAPTVASVGAGIGLLPGGGAQAVSLTLQNRGSATMTNLVLTPSLPPAYGSINTPTLSVASLAAGASHTFNGLTISPLGSLGDDAVLPLGLSVASTQGTYSLQALVPLAGPELTPNSVTGTLSPGQTGNVTLGIRNTGAVSGTGISLTVTSTLPDVLTVNSGAISAGTIAAGGTGSAVLNLTVAGGANRGQPVPLTVAWTSQGGSISGSYTFLFTVGAALSATDPTGPDAYGYWAYENGDASGYAPVYSWYAISAPEGGSGTEVSLTDDGNEQDDGAWVNLPFTFNYYGRSYSQAMVCSNGFISFDEAGFGEFDFRNHTFPTSMGPDAMIAPMWDDHLTTGSTRGAWTWFDGTAHAFVISWYNLSANSSGGPNSFQLVLYDPAYYPTSTGDGPFKFQYQTFNDTQTAGTDFPYCSIGFKDHTSTMGLTLRHWTQQPTTTTAVAAGRAIYISTLSGDFVDVIPPTVMVTPVGTIYAPSPVTVQAQASDMSGLASVTLRYRINAGAWTPLAMAYDGTWYTGTIPGQSAGTQVEFQIDATDASDNHNVTTTATTSYTVQVDAAPPVIAVVPLTFVQPGETPSVNCTISDVTAISSALLLHRVGAGAWQSSAMLHTNGESWVGVLPAYNLGSSVEYYVRATDSAAAPNSADSGHLSYTIVDGNPPTGPDAGGYRWYDSMDAGEGPDFVWMDIAGQGTPLVDSDDVSQTIGLPFPVTYYGTSFTTLTVCSNGWVALGSTGGASYSNTALAVGQDEANMLCAFWDDLHPGSAGEVRAAASVAGDRFVVSWIGVPRYGTNNLQTFQLVFLNTSVYPTVTGDTPVLAQYLQVTDASSCTVGHQNSTRTVGITYLNNGTLAANAAPVVSGQALLLTTGQMPLTPVSGLQIASSGSNVQLSWTANGSSSYRVYGGDAYGPRDTVDATVTSTSVTLPITSAMRSFDVRGTNNYQGAALAAARAGWLPVTVLERHAPQVK
ncbi:MAG: C25 family cysteine peptidase [Candidatus Delongbacteria bacterium]